MENVLGQPTLYMFCMWSEVAPVVYMPYGERARSADRCVHRFVRRSHYTERSHKNRRETNHIITGGSGVIKEKLI